MRKIILAAGIAVGVLMLIGGAVFIYAVADLNSIIAARQKMLIDKVSEALGRPVEIQEIKASLGWGVSIAISGVKIADDPTFSQLPFVVADQVSGGVELLPLLGGNVKVTSLVFAQPRIRVLREAQGQLNVNTIGRGKERAALAAPALQANIAAEKKAAAALRALSIENFRIDGGDLIYSDAQDRGAVMEIKHLDLDVSDFSSAAPFGVNLKLAALGDQQNLDVQGTAGPILGAGSLDLGKLPLDLKIEVGPLPLDKLRGAPQIGSKIPAELSMPDPVSINAALKGSLDNLAFEFASDLSAARVAYIGLFNKPAGTLLKAEGNGTIRDNKLGIADANVKLANLDLNATRVVLGNPMSAQIDTNRFDLAMLSPMLAAIAKYNPSGKAEIHAVAQVDGGKPSMNGTIALTGVAFKPEGTKLPRITELSSNISVAPNATVVEPTTFMIGSSHANLEAQAESIDPLRATYSVKADSLKMAEFVAGRSPGAGEAINQLSVTGSAGRGNTFDQIEPTVRASGKIAVADGKLVGFNLVANALDKVADAPGVSQVITNVFRTSNQTLFGDPDTELDQAAMTFVLSGERVTTHDLTIRSRDYGIRADGWFDLRKRLEMEADITLVRSLDVVIPVVVAGELPEPLVVPDIPRLTERIALGALATPGNVIRGGVNFLKNLLP